MEEGKGDKYADVSPLEQIMDIRFFIFLFKFFPIFSSEYDLPFDMRVCIDGRFFVGHWYTVVGLDLATQKPLIELNPSLVEPPEPIVNLIFCIGVWVEILVKKIFWGFFGFFYVLNFLNFYFFFSQFNFRFVPLILKQLKLLLNSQMLQKIKLWYFI